MSDTIKKEVIDIKEKFNKLSEEVFKELINALKDNFIGKPLDKKEIFSYTYGKLIQNLGRDYDPSLCSKINFELLQSPHGATIGEWIIKPKNLFTFLLMNGVVAKTDLHHQREYTDPETGITYMFEPHNCSTLIKLEAPMKCLSCEVIIK